MKRTPTRSPQTASVNVARPAALVATLLLAAAGPGQAQDPPPDAAMAGDWTGTLTVPGASLDVVFHIKSSASGGWNGTMDSPDQGAYDIPLSAVEVEGDSVTLTLAPMAASFAGRLAGDTLHGTWNQGGLGVPLVLARAADTAPPARPQDPEGPFPYTEQEVRIDAGEGIELAGTLTVPEGGAPHPAALLITGSGPQDRDEALMGHRPFLVLADHLARRGIAVLRLDDRGVGESTGDFAAADSRDFAADAGSAVAWLRARPETDPDAVGLIGHSEGGLIAPMVANASADVAWIVLLAGPGLPGDSLLQLQIARISTASGAPPEAVARQLEHQRAIHAAVRRAGDDLSTAPEVRQAIREGLASMSAAERQRAGLTGPAAVDSLVERSTRQVLSPWFRYFLVHDPRPELRALEVPVLALFGGLDLQVPADENATAARQALQASASPDWDVRVLPGLNHLFQHAGNGLPAEYGRIEETFAPEAMDAVAEWVLQASDRR